MEPVCLLQSVLLKWKKITHLNKTLLARVTAAVQHEALNTLIPLHPLTFLIFKQVIIDAIIL